MDRTLKPAAPVPPSIPTTNPPNDLTRLHEMEWPWANQNLLGFRAARSFLVGTPATVPERYLFASPTTQADPGDPPTLLIHGGSDRVVPIQQSRLLAARLRQVGVPRRLLEFPWADHSFDHATELSWSGHGAQISHSALGRFLKRRLRSPESEATPPDPPDQGAARQATEPGSGRKSP